MFSQPQIKELFNRYVVLRLYTGKTIPPGIDQDPDGPGAVRLRFDKFNNEALPFYAIVRPTGGDGFETVRVYGEGLIRDVDAVARFLREPLEGAPPTPGAPGPVAKR